MDHFEDQDDPLDPRSLFGEVAGDILAKEIARGPCVSLIWALTKKYTHPLGKKPTLCKALKVWRQAHRSRDLEDLKAFLGLGPGETTKDGVFASVTVLELLALARMAEELLDIAEAYIPRLEELEELEE